MLSFNTCLRFSYTSTTLSERFHKILFGSSQFLKSFENKVNTADSIETAVVPNVPYLSYPSPTLAFP